MKVEKSLLFAMFYSILIFVGSIVISPMLINGDQEAYHNFYNNCFNIAGLSSQYGCYGSTLGTQEPIYFLITKLFHSLIDKNILMAFFNAIIVFLFVKLVYRFYLKTNLIHLFFILFFLNYYVVVLFFSAERLKLSVLFLLISFFLIGVKSFYSKILMILTHIQMVFIYFVYFIYSFFDKNNKKLWVKFVMVVGGSIFLGVIYYYMRDHIDRKFVGYSNIAFESNLGLVSLLKSLIFMLFTYISVQKNIVILMQIPLIIGAYILGSGRMLIMSFFVYIACLIYFKGKVDFLGYIVLFYFAFKSIEFWQNVIKYGTGFLEV